MQQQEDIDNRQYRRYAEWCSRLGLRAAAFDVWARTTFTVGGKWHAMQSELMRGHSASRFRPGGQHSPAGNR